MTTVPDRFGRPVMISNEQAVVYRLIKSRGRYYSSNMEGRQYTLADQMCKMGVLNRHIKDEGEVIFTLWRE